MKIASSLLVLMLAGCTVQASGDGAASPLMAGLAAVKAGNAEQLGVAVAQAEASLEPIRAAADPCALATPVNRVLAEEREAVQALARPMVISMSEEARFLLALSVAEQGRFAGESEVFASCPPPTDQEAGGLAGFAAIAGGVRGAKARGEFLHGWRSELETRHGAQFDARMKGAASLLTQNGIEAGWPMNYDLMAGGEEWEGEPPGSFADAQAAVE